METENCSEIYAHFIFKKTVVPVNFINLPKIWEQSESSLLRNFVFCIKSEFYLTTTASTFPCFQIASIELKFLRHHFFYIDVIFLHQMSSVTKTSAITQVHDSEEKTIGQSSKMACLLCMSENKKENSGNQGMKITNCGICYSRKYTQGILEHVCRVYFTED